MSKINDPSSNIHQTSAIIHQTLIHSVGRMELAQQYFPNIQPRSAWLKMRALMLEIPDLSAFAIQKRRTFLPNEVNIIYQCLGHP